MTTVEYWQKKAFEMEQYATLIVNCPEKNCAATPTAHCQDRYGNPRKPHLARTLAFKRTLSKQQEAILK